MIDYERQQELRRVYFSPNFSGTLELTQEEMQYVSELGQESTDILANEVFEERVTQIEHDVEEIRDEIAELRSQLDDG